MLWHLVSLVKYAITKHLFWFLQVQYGKKNRLLHISGGKKRPNKRRQIGFYSANVKANMQANKHMGVKQTGFDNNDWTQKQRTENKQQFYPASTLMQIMRLTRMHKFGKYEGERKEK